MQNIFKAIKQMNRLGECPFYVAHKLNISVETLREYEKGMEEKANDARREKIRNRSTMLSLYLSRILPIQISK